MITRKSLIVGAGMGLLAIATGCRQAGASGQDASSGRAAPKEPHAWGYAGSEGPENWSSLSSGYQSCSTGSAQSPIDVPHAALPAAKPIALGYTSTDTEVTNNGHSIELRALSAQHITVGGVAHSFKQMHFHAPSEHTVAGVRYAAEFHFVHQSDDGHIAVLGVLAKAGPESQAWAPFVDAAATASAPGSGSASAAGVLDLAALLPRGLDHFAYDGSLTSPPCSENVRWLLLETPLELGASQLGKLTSVHSNNNRPTQPLNGRKIILVDQ